MLKSMTGFGQAARVADGYRIQVDMKSVNHRYCEIMVRMPREWFALEEGIKKAVQQSVNRGRVDLFVTIERENGGSVNVEINWPLVEGYIQAAEQIKNKVGISEPLSLSELLRIPEIMQFKDQGEEQKSSIEAGLRESVADALAQLTEMRSREGIHLQADLSERLAASETIFRDMLLQAPKVVEELKGKVRQRLQELLSDPALFDENRFAMEVAVIADRSNIDEELTRLQSHFQQFRSLLQASEPVGRKMDFLIQEMNREVNTIGSKANSTTLAVHVVEMKAELEKIREQVQNLE